MNTTLETIDEAFEVALADVKQEEFDKLKASIAIAKGDGTFSTRYRKRWKDHVREFIETPIADDVLRWAKQEWNLSDAELQPVYNKLDVITKLGKYPEDADDFVRLYVCAERITVRLDSIQNPGRKDGACSMSDLINDLYAFVHDYSLRYAERRIEVAAEKWHRDEVIDCLKEILASLTSAEAQDPNSEMHKAATEQWAKFIGIIDKNPATREQTLAVFKHWVWNIKRVMNPMKLISTKDPMMIVLTGRTGNGKSTAVETFLSPLQRGGYTKTEFDKLVDPNYYMQCATIPVAFLDEMAKLEKVDKERLKGFITDDYSSARKMYTQQVDKKRKIIQLIGASNWSMEIINTDTTSARRFYEVETPNDMKQAHPDWMYSIDWLLLWQSVDASGADPMTKSISEAVSMRQHNEQRKKNYVEDWIWANRVKNTYTGQEAYDLWLKWAETNDRYWFTHASSVDFGRKLKAIDGVRNSRNGKGIKYVIDVDFSVVDDGTLI
ncbi:VapE family protein [Telmatobacter sp. DSM 110680]|uniref:VapE family protein n=1 Tax=Telmatobacter sp. DSM 110680 TaxID=3036704 RepID=A0AAU7DN73_9BACT